MVIDCVDPTYVARSAGNEAVMCVIVSKTLSEQRNISLVKNDALRMSRVTIVPERSLPQSNKNSAAFEMACKGAAYESCGTKDAQAKQGYL